MTMWTRTREGTVVYVSLNTELISAAAAVAMLAAYAAAQLVVIAAAPGTDRHTIDSRAYIGLIRRAYPVAAALGTTVTAFYGLAIGSLVGVTTTEYLSAALTPAVPLAILALLVALLAPRMGDRISAWLPTARPAVIPIIVATLGILAMHYALNTTSTVIGGAGLLARLGAAAAGAGVALTIAQRPVTRIITTTILALGCLIVVSPTNVALITIGYAAAAIWWALTVAAGAVLAAFPSLGETTREVIAPLIGPRRPPEHS
jgi:hypothetical protein